MSRQNGNPTVNYEKVNYKEGAKLLDAGTSSDSDQTEHFSLPPLDLKGGTRRKKKKRITKTPGKTPDPSFVYRKNGSKSIDSCCNLKCALTALIILVLILAVLGLAAYSNALRTDIRELKEGLKELRKRNEYIPTAKESTDFLARLTELENSVKYIKANVTAISKQITAKGKSDSQLIPPSMVELPQVTEIEKRVSTMEENVGTLQKSSGSVTSQIEDIVSRVVHLENIVKTGRTTDVAAGDEKSSDVLLALQQEVQNLSQILMTINSTWNSQFDALDEYTVHHHVKIGSLNNFTQSLENRISLLELQIVDSHSTPDTRNIELRLDAAISNAIEDLKNWTWSIQGSSSVTNVQLVELQEELDNCTLGLKAVQRNIYELSNNAGSQLSHIDLEIMKNRSNVDFKRLEENLDTITNVTHNLTIDVNRNSDRISALESQSIVKGIVTSPPPNDQQGKFGIMETIAPSPDAWKAYEPPEEDRNVESVGYNYKTYSSEHDEETGQQATHSWKADLEPNGDADSDYLYKLGADVQKDTTPSWITQHGENVNPQFNPQKMDRYENQNDMTNSFPVNGTYGTGSSMNNVTKSENNQSEAVEQGEGHTNHSNATLTTTDEINVQNDSMLHVVKSDTVSNFAINITSGGDEAASASDSNNLTKVSADVSKESPHDFQSNMIDPEEKANSPYYRPGASRFSGYREAYSGSRLRNQPSETSNYEKEKLEGSQTEIGKDGDTEHQLITFPGVSTLTDLKRNFIDWDKDSNRILDYGELTNGLGRDVPSPAELAPFDNGDGSYTLEELQDASGLTASS